MRSPAVTLLAVLLCGAAAAQTTEPPHAPGQQEPPAPPSLQQPELAIGDKAPSLTDVEWIKGDPVQSFQPGTIYVLDFWATWCQPCLASIPHLNEIAQEYRDRGVQVVGLAIWPREGMVPTAEFVQSKGAGMDYTVGEDVDGRTARAYMQAAGQTGIPTVMVVDRSGTLAWIGHPMALEEPLGQVVEGTYDLAAARQQFEAQRETSREQERIDALAQPLAVALQQARAAGDWEEVAELSARLAALHDMFVAVNILQYDALVRAGDEQEARELGQRLVERDYAQHPQLLGSLAWTIVDPEPEPALGDEQRDLALALKAAEIAERLAEERGDPALHADILDTLARVHFWTGDVDRAIELQNEALAEAPPPMRPYLQRVLEEYRRAEGGEGEGEGEG